VKIKTIIEYFRSTSFAFFTLFLAAYLLMNVSSALGNFWLSDWSSRVAQNEEPNKLNNKFRLLVYGLFGLSQSKIFEFIINQQ
jgi:hypothetical protein